MINEDLDTFFDPAVLKRHPPLSDFYKRVGRTPIIQVPTPTNHGKIFAKCEWENPGRTIKARAALAMIWRLLGQQDERRLEDITILEYSGGGLSLALSELCHMLGLKLVLVLCESTPKSIVNQLYLHGAVIHFSNKAEGFWGVMLKARELKQRNPEWFFLYQHENDANLRYHVEFTSREILDQLEFPVHAWVASIGTGATLAGVYSGIKEQYPGLKMYAAMPKEMPYATMGPPNSLPKFAGSGGLGEGRKQRFISVIDNELVDQFLVSHEDATLCMRRYFLQTGVMIGSSSAANLICAYNLAERYGPDKNILTVFPSAALAEEHEYFK